MIPYLLGSHTQDNSIALNGEGVALAGGLVEEHGGGGGGIKGFNTPGHGDANASVRAAFDFFGETRAFVADEESDGVAPVYFPRGKGGLVGRVAKTGRQ